MLKWIKSWLAKSIIRSTPVVVVPNSTEQKSTVMGG